jgi:hypothetical protein
VIQLQLCLISLADDEAGNAVDVRLDTDAQDAEEKSDSAEIGIRIFGYIVCFIFPSPLFQLLAVN